MVNIEKDPEALIENMENLIPFAAALALNYDSTVGINCFLGEELGGGCSSPFCDIPVTKCPDLPFVAGEAINRLVSKGINHYANCARNALDEQTRRQYAAKEKRLRTERLNILVNPYNFGGTRSHLWWYKAIIDFLANPANKVGRIFLLRRMDYETTAPNLGDINDLSMYTDDHDQTTHLLKIHFPPEDIANNPRQSQTASRRRTSRFAFWKSLELASPNPVRLTRWT